MNQPEIDMDEAKLAALRIIAIDEGEPGADDEVDFLDSVAVARAFVADPWKPVDGPAHRGLILGWDAGYRVVAVLIWSERQQKFTYANEQGNPTMAYPWTQPTLYRLLPEPPPAGPGAVNG